MPNNLVSPTDAWKKADSVRTERHSIYRKLVTPDFSATAFIGENSLGNPIAVIYKGKSLKPSSNYYYKTIERRDQVVQAFFDQCIKSNNSKKISISNDCFEIGDVLISQWGHEQTNNDYYLVTDLIGSTMVQVVEIDKIKNYTADMNGTSLPVVNKIIGEPIRRKVTANNYVGISSYSAAKKLQKNDDGEFLPSFFTSYA